MNSDGFRFLFFLLPCVRVVAVSCFCFPVVVQCESLSRVGLFLSVSLARPVHLCYPLPGFVFTVLGFSFLILC